MVIRKIQTSDANSLLNFFKELVLLDPERVERPEDVNKITKEMEEKWIEQRLTKEEKKDIFVLCGLNDEGKMVTEGEVERLPRWIERHVAEIRFGVLPQYDLIAEKTVEELIKTAKNNGIEVLMYFHLETQKAGINIMKKLGFESFGAIKNFYKRDKEYVDRIYLAKYL